MLSLFEFHLAPHFQGHTGEMVGKLGFAQFFLTECRIVHNTIVIGDFRQHHKMVEIPMQNTRQAQVFDFVQF